jgi:flagellar capping protein FliD
MNSIKDNSSKYETQIKSLSERLETATESLIEKEAEIVDRD